MDILLKWDTQLNYDDGLGSFIYEHKVRSLLSGKDFRWNGSAGCFGGISEITINFPRMVSNVFERIFDRAKNRVMTLSVAASI